MEGQQENTPSSEPHPCRNSNCPFYGTSETEGLCSKCYKDFRQQSQDEGAPQDPTGATATSAPVTADTNITSAPQDTSVNESSSSAVTTTGTTTPVKGETPKAGAQDTPDARMEASASAADSDPQPTTKKVQKNRKKCWVCRKKVNLLGFDCRCGYVFCAEHRHPDQHECDFDHAQVDIADLEQKNQKVAKDSLERV